MKRKRIVLGRGHLVAGVASYYFLGQRMNKERIGQDWKNATLVVELPPPAKKARKR